MPEAEALAGMTIADDDDRREAARRIAALGARAVVVKGGHCPIGDIVDLLFDGQAFTEFRARAGARHQHARHRLHVLGRHHRAARARPRLQEAIPLAQDYVAKAIRNAPGLGSGHGPMGHL